jgi:hypothetical protein
VTVIIFDSSNHQAPGAPDANHGKHKAKQLPRLSGHNLQAAANPVLHQGTILEVAEKLVLGIRAR